MKVKIKPKNKLDVGSSIFMEWLFVQHVLVKLEFRVLVFVEGAKVENLERLLWSKDRKSQKFKPQVTSGFRIKLGPQVRGGGGGGGRGELIHSLPCYPYSLTASCVR